MDNTDQKWIAENITEVEEKTDDEFEGQVFFSTDGKMTVSAKASTKAGRKAALAWSKAVYDRINYTFGSKQAHAAKEYKNVDKPVSAEECLHTDKKESMSHTAKNPGRLFETCKTCGKFCGWKS